MLSKLTKAYELDFGHHGVELSMMHVKPMKLSICNRIWCNYPFEEAVKRIASLGYDGIEIWGCRPHAYTFDMDDEAIRDRKRAIAEAGLEVPCLTPDQFYPAPYINPASPYEKYRKQSIEFLKASLDCAAKFGAPMMSMAPGKCLYGQSKSNAWQLLVQAVGECADRARSLGLKLAVEPCPPIETNLMSTLHDFLQLSRDVNATNLGCLLDIAHQNITHENCTDFAKVLGDKLYHIHISDNGGTIDQGLVPGDGTVQFQPFMRSLRESGYAGYLSLEMTFSYQQDPDSAAYRAKRFMDNLFGEKT
jgi:protein FrlC